MHQPSAKRAPRQQRAIRTRRALVEAGARTFSAAGYAATTTKAIAERAGVATGTFYQYFTDKDVLLREIAASRLAGIATDALTGLVTDAPLPATEVAAEARTRIEAMIAMITAYHRDDPGLHAVLTERRHADAELEALTASAERALVERIAVQLERWGHPGDRLATAFVLFGMVEGTVHAHVLGVSVVSDERFTYALTDALLRVALPSRNDAPNQDRSP